MGPALPETKYQVHAPLTHSPDLWFDDGSVVLHVESTLFKVHRSILSSNSEVFCGMFSVPQPPTNMNISDGVIDGCPVVHLPDHAMDWTHVLKALYDAMSVLSLLVAHTRCLNFYGCRNSHVLETDVPFESVAAFLRLGTKYSIRQLRMQAMKLLFAEYPTTLEKWDVTAPKDHPRIRYESGIHFRVANLASEVGLHAILPACLYYHFEDTDGHDNILNGSFEDGQLVAELSPENKLIALRGWFRLLKKQHETTYKWLDTDGSLFPGCQTMQKCDVVRRDIFYRSFRRYTYCVPLAQWDPTDENAGLCQFCVVTSKQLHNEGRTKVWQELPSTFDLPGWDELLRYSE